MKRVSLLMLAFAIGCGGNKATDPSANNGQAASTQTAPKPSDEEARASIQAYLTDPSSGVGFQSVEVESVSQPMQGPKEVEDAWVYSVSMKCESILGDKLHNKNWVMLVGRQDGKVKVKECFNNLERIKESPLGNDWWAKSGLPEPTSTD